MQSYLKQNNVLWGLLLIALGAFFLMQVTGLFGVLSTLFWSLAFGTAGAIFLYVFFTGLHTRWWAAIPGFTLLGLAATVFYSRFAPPFISGLGGAVFLGAIAAAFLVIFVTNPRLWWALIPGGALLSLAGVVFVEALPVDFINPGSVLFVGLGLTFALLGLLSTYLGVNLRWAYIPAAVLLLLGLVVVTPFTGGFAVIWPLALIGIGTFLVLRNVQRRNTSAGVAEPAQQVVSNPAAGAVPVAPPTTPVAAANGGSATNNTQASVVIDATARVLQ